jgi:phosphopantothenoylcysteine decarboxylase/phosphopantothenate--cysteine ligase
MFEPWQIEEHVGRALARGGPLAGRAVLVTAGPTREPVDPVRYVGNRSSGRMGYAIAQAAWRRGAQVTLVSGPSALTRPVGVEVVPVETAVEMWEAVGARVSTADVSVFAAAVADFRPADPKSQKVKRAESDGAITIELTENPDVARDTIAKRKEGSIAVGFALETTDLIENAEKKLSAKAFDLIVANDANDPEAGFDVATNRVTILSNGRAPEAFPAMIKEAVAEEILDRIEALVEAT